MKECPICREIHGPERTLSYDGKGINACGMYRTRIATFTSGAMDGAVALLGPMFAAAPDMLAALAECETTLDQAAELLAEIGEEGDRWAEDKAKTCVNAAMTARAAIAKAKGEA